MPVLSTTDPNVDKRDYFDSLNDLDKWASEGFPQSVVDDVLPYRARSEDISGDLNLRGKLQVCHDYKGGYVENPSGLTYTYNFWQYCDTFTYFSHHRITIPPASWITAAHRQGVKILGVLIFEHPESAEDCLRLLVGKTPKSRTGPVSRTQQRLPVSPYYARLLARLASERGFDGYLLNFEYALPGGAEQARALDAWISLLDIELKRFVGNHAQAVWYDSIVITGQVAWQNRLNSGNLPFFLSSTSFFTNYWWKADYPLLCFEYLSNIDPSFTGGKRRPSQDILVGIDVWGRGTYGGGGLSSYKALERINPDVLGLSAALFGFGWTWESEEGKDGWSWENWWALEKTFWVGPPNDDDVVEVPNIPSPPNNPEAEHGPFRPISDFFDRLPPPNPSVLPFYSSFCPGVGFSWFVNGIAVMKKDSGWTDIDKQTSLGDMLWPRPNLSLESETMENSPPTAVTSLDFKEAFASGSSALLELTGTIPDTEEDGFVCAWIPVQSLSIKPRKFYDATVVYKVEAKEAEVDCAFSVRSLIGDVVEIAQVDGSESFDINGWTSTTVRFAVGDSDTPEDDQKTAFGIVLGIVTLAGASSYKVSIRLGQFAVSPTLPAMFQRYESRLLWADCQKQNEVLEISWGTSVSFPEVISPEIPLPERTIPKWTLNHSQNWLPGFLYYNIYVVLQENLHGQEESPPDSALFVGTSGTYRNSTRFALDRLQLPEYLQRGLLRIYIQGVSDRGQVLTWEQCVFVDEK